MSNEYKPQHTNFTHPSHLNVLPKPSFEFLFHLECAFTNSRIQP